MSEAFSNSGDKLFICVTPQPDDLDDGASTGFPSLLYVQVKKVGSAGERGISTNILTYDTWDTQVALKAKGITNAGDPQVEVAEDLTDPGQTAMRAAGDPYNKGNYAFKVERSDGSLEYWRGLVAGPNIPGGRNEDFRLNVFTIALQQAPIVVAAPVGP